MWTKRDSCEQATAMIGQSNVTVGLFSTSLDIFWVSIPFPTSGWRSVFISWYRKDDTWEFIEEFNHLLLTKNGGLNALVFPTVI